VIAQSGRPEFLSDSGTGTLSGWAFRDAAAPASGTRRRAPVQPITRIRWRLLTSVAASLGPSTR